MDFLIITIFKRIKSISTNTVLEKEISDNTKIELLNMLINNGASVNSYSYVYKLMTPFTFIGAENSELPLKLVKFLVKRCAGLFTNIGTNIFSYSELMTQGQETPVPIFICFG